jgi:hypothetical protein
MFFLLFLLSVTTALVGALAGLWATDIPLWGSLLGTGLIGAFVFGVLMGIEAVAQEEQEKKEEG